MFQAFSLDTMRIWQTKKQKTVITTYKEFLGTCITSKEKSTYTVCINWSKFFKLPASTNLAL